MRELKKVGAEEERGEMKGRAIKGKELRGEEKKGQRDGIRT